MQGIISLGPLWEPWDLIGSVTIGDTGVMNFGNYKAFSDYVTACSGLGLVEGFDASH